MVLPAALQVGMERMPMQNRNREIDEELALLQEEEDILTGKWKPSAGYGEIAIKHAQNLPDVAKATGGTLLQSLSELGRYSPQLSLAGSLASAFGGAQIGSKARQEAQTSMAGNQPYIRPEDTGKQYISDVVRGTEEMLPGLTASLAMKNPLPMLGQAGVQGLTGSFGEQRDAGRTPLQSAGAAIPSAAAEVVFELPVFKILSKGGTPFLKRAISSIVGEGASEGATAVVQKAIEMGTIKPDMTLGQLLDEAGYEALVGAGVGGVISAPAQIADVARRPRAAKESEFYVPEEGIQDEFSPQEQLALPAPDKQLALPAPEQRLGLAAPEEQLALSAPDYSAENRIMTPEGKLLRSEAREKLISTPEGLRYESQDEKNRKQRDIELGLTDTPRLSQKAIGVMQRARVRKQALQVKEAEKVKKAEIRQEVKEQNEAKNETLFNFIAKKGGIKPSETARGDLKQIIDKASTYRFGKGNVIDKKGRDLDKMAREAATAGFIPEDNTDLLLDAIRKEVAGEPVRRPETLVEPTTKDYIEDLHIEADKMGISTEGKTPEALFSEMEASLQKQMEAEEKKQKPVAEKTQEQIEEDPMLALERMEVEETVEDDDFDMPWDAPVKTKAKKLPLSTDSRVKHIHNYLRKKGWVGDSVTLKKIVESLEKEGRESEINNVLNNPSIANIRELARKFPKFMKEKGKFSELKLENFAQSVDSAMANVEKKNGGGTFYSGLDPALIKKLIPKKYRGMKQEEFLGEARRVGAEDSKYLKPKEYEALEKVEKEPFLGGKYKAKYGENMFAVYDGDKVIANYNWGDTLIVDKKHRKQGIGEELIYQWRIKKPDRDLAKTRNVKSTKLQKKVYDRIQKELKKPSESEGSKLDSPAFKKWFGKSKVVDESGKPKVVYHGTTNLDKILESGFKKGWVHLSDSKPIADSYQDWNKGDSKGTLPLYAKAENPAYFDAEGKKYTEIGNKVFGATYDAEKKGHDALIIKNIRDHNDSSVPVEPHTTIVVFEPTQIKSVENKGTYSPTDSRILYSGFDPKLISELFGSKEERAEFYAGMKKVPSGLKALGKNAGGIAGTGFLSIDDNLRIRAKIYNMPTIKKIADMLYGGTQDTYGEAVRTRQTINHNKIERILKPIRKSKPMLDRTIHLIQNPKEIKMGRSHADNAAVGIARLLKAERQYMVDAGVEVGEIEGYFPRVYDLIKILKNEQAFLGAAKRAYRDTYPDMSSAEISEKAQGWLDNVKLNNAGVSVDGNDFQTRAGIPKPNSLKERTLSKKADGIMKQFLLADPQEVLTQHFIQTAKRAEFERRFNLNDWKALKADMVKEADASGKENAHDAVRKTVADIMAATGNNVGNMPQGASDTLAWVKMFGAMAMLPHAVVTALPEVVMPALRAGDVRESFAGLTGAWRALMKDSTYAEQKEIAEEVIGVAAKAVSDMAAEQRMGGELGTATTNKLMAKYFTATGLHGFTEGMRVVSTGVGMRYLDRLSKDMAKNPKKTKFYMQDLGIAEKDAQGFSEWVQESGKMTKDTLKGDGKYQPMYKRALTRFVDQSVIKPEAAEKPRYASHKIGSLFYYLQSFIYGFQKNVIMRQAINVKRATTEKDLSVGNRAAMMAPLLLTPIILGALQYGLGDLRDKALDSETKKKMSKERQAARALSRTGYYGQLDPWINLFAGLKYRREPATTLAGPVFGGLLDTFASLAALKIGNSKNTNTQERKAAKQTWRTFVKPSMMTMFSAMPGYLKAPLIQMMGHPQVEEEFIKSVAGKKRK